MAAAPNRCPESRAGTAELDSASVVVASVTEPVRCARTSVTARPATWATCCNRGDVAG